MFRRLLLLLSGRCCYLGCSNFSTILLIVIRISWYQNMFNMRFYLSASRTIITSINGTVFWTIFGTVLYGTVFLYFAMFFRTVFLYFAMFFRTVLYWTVLYGTVLYRHGISPLVYFEN